MIDYIDEDVAYLLGMIYARGEFQDTATRKSFNITLENTSIEAEGIRSTTTHKVGKMMSLPKILERVSDILETDLRHKDHENSLILYANFTRSSIGWRDLRFLTNYKYSHREFCLPDFFFDLEIPIKEQFLKGFCDIAGYVRKSNADRSGFHRIYLQISNKNWILPTQICKLLQVDFGIPVQSLQWGHPNTREPHRIKVKPSSSTWAKEHQIRIYADEFGIGFGFDYKQKILEELARYNISAGKRKSQLCYPNKKTKTSRKPKHPGESSDLLPNELRGRHFNSYRSICKALGCCQRKPRSNQFQLKLTK